MFCWRSASFRFEMKEQYDFSVNPAPDCLPDVLTAVAAIVKDEDSTYTEENDRFKLEIRGYNHQTLTVFSQQELSTIAILKISPAFGSGRPFYPCGERESVL